MREGPLEARWRALVLALMLTALACSIGIPFLAFLAPGPLPAPGNTVYVRPGENFRAVAAKLAEANVVRSALLLRWGATVSGKDHSIRPGVYRFTGRRTLAEVLDFLASGGEEKLVTVPEGLTVAQVASLLENEGLGAREDYLALANDQDFARLAGIAADSLEGYVFPDTYRLSEVMSAGDVLRLMVRRFHQVVDPELQPGAAELGMTPEQIIILASIIEKETGDPAERPLVSAVFHNRLVLGMPLQSDPTVAYALNLSDAKLSKQDLADPNPYNTYTHPGLPPGPIANPGLAAIRAALSPARTGALYFVSRNNGTHEFSTTFGAHKQAVARYQLNRP